METNNKDLIWVEKEFAEKYKKLEDKSEKNAERIKIFEEYIDKVSNSSKSEFKACLESLEEDAAMYTGLMLKVKKTFNDVSNTALCSFEDIWEDYDKNKTTIVKKIKDVTTLLNPLKEQVDSIEKTIKSISSYNLDRLVESLSLLNTLSEKNLDILKFVVKNYD